MKNVFCMILISMGLLADTLPKGAVQANMDDMYYHTAPKPFPPVPMVILEGEPFKEGIYTFRIKVPAHQKIPLHWHSKDERVTLIKGEICIGFSDEMDYIKGNCMKEGGFYINPKNVNHYLWTKDEETILQVTGEGAWNMTMVKKQGE